MSDDTKDAITIWATDFIKSVGFPIAVCCVVLWFGFQQIKSNEERSDERIKSSDARAEKMTDFTMTTMTSLIQQDMSTRQQMITAIDRLNSTIDRKYP